MGLGLAGAPGEAGCDTEALLEPALVVLSEDLESLRRTYSEEERLELWNEVRSSFRRFTVRCSARLPRKLVRLVKGRFRLAMLMLAASFKVNGEEHSNIVSMFKPEEYQLLLDFEEYKIFDDLDIDTIVEFIRRREGKVYELVKDYYEKQYNALDTKWAGLMGDLVYAIEERYRQRRRKIEEAVIQYVRRYGLTLTVSEIEEAVKKAYEAGELRRRIEEEVRKKIMEEYRLSELLDRLEELELERNSLLERLRELESRAAASGAEAAQLAAALEEVRREKQRLQEMYGKTLERLRMLEREVEEARRQLERKEEELRRAMEQYRSSKEALEALEAEREALRATVERLTSQLEEYRKTLSRVSERRELLEERLREVEAALRGETEGKLVTREEAAALVDSYIARVLYKAAPPGKAVPVYDPRAGRSLLLLNWDEKLTLSGGDGKGLRGLLLVKRRGLLSKKKTLVLEVATILHDSSYREKGYDARPAGLDEVIDIVEPRLDDAEKSGYYHILVIASPTGFTGKALEYVSGTPGKGLVSRYLTLYLVDLASARLYFNRADPAAKGNARLVAPELPEETIKKVIDYVMSSEALAEAFAVSPASPMLTLDMISRAVGVEDAAALRKALARLEEQGMGRVIVADEPKGVLAFRYSDNAIRKLSNTR